MGRPEGTLEARITREREWAQLIRNLQAMSQRLGGEPLHNIRRKLAEDPSFLASEQPVLHQALYELPAWSALYSYTKGEFPTYKQADKIALFCTKAFAFDRTITTEDLLTRDLSPFPPLRQENERWGRYVGLYRGFYLYPDSLEGEKPQLHGSLLQLREEDGNLLCRWVTGIRRDERFDELEALLTAHPASFDAVQSYNQSLPPYEGRLVFYEGVMEPVIPGHFLMKLQRKDHSNAALVILRRWSDSAQAHYSGGVALVNLFRDQSKAAMSSFPMLLARENMTLTQEKALLTRHLRYADQRQLGLRISVDMDRSWNQALMEWGYRKSEADSKRTLSP